MSLALARAGKRVINLCHMIDAEDDAPECGELTVHVLPGREIVLRGMEAQELRLALLAAAPARGIEIAIGRPTR